MCILRHSIGEDLRILENSQNSREFSGFSRILRISKLKNEGAGDIWLEAGDFPLPDERPAHFSRPFLTLRWGDPGDHEGARLRWKFEIATYTYRPHRFYCRRSCLDVGSNRNEYPTTLGRYVAPPGDTVQRRIET